jgi:hypothetical protein
MSQAGAHSERSLRPILERFGTGIKLKSLFSQGKENNRLSERRFPPDGSQEPGPFIATRKLRPETFAVVGDYSRARGPP